MNDAAKKFGMAYARMQRGLDGNEILKDPEVVKCAVKYANGLFASGKRDAAALICSRLPFDDIPSAAFDRVANEMLHLTFLNNESPDRLERCCGLFERASSEKLTLIGALIAFKALIDRANETNDNVLRLRALEVGESLKPHIDKIKDCDDALICELIKLAISACRTLRVPNIADCGLEWVDYYRETKDTELMSDVVEWRGESMSTIDMCEELFGELSVEWSRIQSTRRLAPFVAFLLSSLVLIFGLAGGKFLGVSALFVHFATWFCYPYIAVWFVSFLNEDV